MHVIFTRLKPKENGFCSESNKIHGSILRRRAARSDFCRRQTILTGVEMVQSEGKERFTQGEMIKAKVEERC